MLISWHWGPAVPTIGNLDLPERKGRNEISGKSKWKVKGRENQQWSQLQNLILKQKLVASKHLVLLQLRASGLPQWLTEGLTESWVYSPEQGIPLLPKGAFLFLFNCRLKPQNQEATHLKSIHFSNWNFSLPMRSWQQWPAACSVVTYVLTPSPRLATY